MESEKDMPMKHCTRLIAVILAGMACSASADNTQVIVSVDQACPAGTTSRGASYRWEHGRFVREGWVCDDRQTRN